MLTGKNVQKIADVAGGATGAQAGVQYQLGPDVGGALVVEFGTTGTVMLQGRISLDAPWANLLAANLTEAAGLVQAVSIGRTHPEMRLNIVANGSTIKAWVMA